jgi:hypothetical protein
VITFHVILARKHGEADGYPVLAAFNEAGWIAVHKKYNEIVDSEAGAEFRAAHAEVQVYQNFDLFAAHEFPNPADVEVKRRASALADARRIRAANETAKKHLADAKNRALEAQSAIRTLTDEQKQLLEEADAAVRAVEEKAEREKADAEAKTELAREQREKAEQEQATAAQESAKAGTKALSSAAQ